MKYKENEKCNFRSANNIYSNQNNIDKTTKCKINL